MHLGKLMQENHSAEQELRLDDRRRLLLPESIYHVLEVGASYAIGSRRRPAVLDCEHHTNLHVYTQVCGFIVCGLIAKYESTNQINFDYQSTDGSSVRLDRSKFGKILRSVA